MTRKPAHLEPPFTATPKQEELARAWHDPANRVVLIGGAIRSGKTQAAGRLLVETAIAKPSLYLVARMTYRELRDSTQRAMLHGDGALPPLIPPDAVDVYRASDELVRLRNGSEIIFRSLDEPGKLLNLSLGGVFVDQIEELDEGAEGERLFDTLLGRLSDPRGPRKLVAVANPGGMTHWVHRRLVDPKTRDPDTAYVHITLEDNAENLPPDYVAAMLATEKTRPHWFRSFIRGMWGSFEGAAYEEFDPALHVVEPFSVTPEWVRFESMDFGSASPTAWLAWAVDYDGNLIAFDEHYAAGWLVSAHAAEVRRRRATSWLGRDFETGREAFHYCYADPSIKASHGLTSRRGVPASVMTEFLEHGVDWLVPANNNRSAGYARLLELIHPDPARPFPAWHPRSGEYGSPRLFIFKSCENLVAQLQSAKIATEGEDAGKVVDGKWESAHGHQHASARYGVMSRPAPSPTPPPPLPESASEWRSFRMRELIEAEERRWDERCNRPRRATVRV